MTAFLRSAAPSVFYLKAAVFPIISIIKFENRTTFDTLSQKLFNLINIVFFYFFLVQWCILVKLCRIQFHLILNAIL